jgi:hypothetical protein
MPTAFQLLNFRFLTSQFFNLQIFPASVSVFTHGFSFPMSLSIPMISNPTKSIYLLGIGIPVLTSLLRRRWKLFHAFLPGVKTPGNNIRHAYGISSLRLPYLLTPYFPTSQLLHPTAAIPKNTRFKIRCCPQLNEEIIPPQEQGTRPASPNQTHAT